MAQKKPHRNQGKSKGSGTGLSRLQGILIVFLIVQVVSMFLSYHKADHKINDNTSSIPRLMMEDFKTNTAAAAVRSRRQQSNHLDESSNDNKNKNKASALGAEQQEQAAKDGDEDSGEYYESDDGGKFNKNKDTAEQKGGKDREKGEIANPGEGGRGGEKIPPKANSELLLKEDVLTKHGSGPTSVGYVVDFLAERQRPAFRNQPLPTTEYCQKMEESVSTKLQEQQQPSNLKVKSCHRMDERRYLTDEKCRVQQKTTATNNELLFAYNTAPFARSLCGITIPPNGGVIKLNESCRERVARIFPVNEPPLNGNNMPPIIVQNTQQRSVTGDADADAVADSELETIPCDVPCQWEKPGTAKKDSNEKYIGDTAWKLIVDENSPDEPERTAFRNNVYYSTKSGNSNVPINSFKASEHLLAERPALDFDEALPSASYLIDSQCYGGEGRRGKWFAAIRAQIETASYGGCDHNKDPDPDQGETLETIEGRIALMKKHRIHLAFEMRTAKDHMTETTYEALLSGAVPVILGASNARELLPKHSAIYTSGYNNWDKLAEYVKKVMNNKILWESYHAWRKDPAEVQKYEERFNFTQTTPQCRTCRWAYAKKYGLGWTHKQQLIRPPHIAKNLCVATTEAKKLVTKPFHESWLGGTTSLFEHSQEEKQHHDGPSSSSECGSSLESEASIGLNGNHKVIRKVTAHDGVVDMSISTDPPLEYSDQDIVLRLQVRVRNSEGAIFRDVHTSVSNLTHGAIFSSASVKDDKSKVTVLTNWETHIHSPEMGIIEVRVFNVGNHLHRDETRRIRIITEDVDELHEKLTEYYPSHVESIMIKDFVDPIEFFYAINDNGDSSAAQ